MVLELHSLAIMGRPGLKIEKSKHGLVVHAWTVGNVSKRPFAISA